MILRVPLPAQLPTGDADLRLGFRRIPARSCFVRPTLRDAQGAELLQLRELTVYGRGEGSEATERAYLSVPLVASALARLTPKPAFVELCVSELDGNPVAETGFLELIEQRVIPRS